MATVTCRTEGCANAGAPIDLELTWLDEDENPQPVDAVVCGVCGKEITEVTA